MISIMLCKSDNGSLICILIFSYYYKPLTKFILLISLAETLRNSSHCKSRFGYKVTLI